MKTLIGIFAALLVSSAVQAQTYTMDWATSFSTAWATGTTNGTANNAGGSGVKVTVALTKTGGAYTTTLGAFGGPQTPTVTNATDVVPGSSSKLQIALDYDLNTEYTDINVTFNKPVLNVSFRIADVDRLTNTSNSYFDQIVVTGFNGALSGSPTITKYDAITDPNWLIIAGGTVHVNTGNNMAGNSASDATDQRGTVNVKFTGVYLTSLRIRYENAAGTMADPGVQNVSIGDISFQTSIALPVRLLSFDGKTNDDGTVDLNWKTANEVGFDHYAVERSSNGTDFTELGQVKASSNENDNYSYQDRSAGSGKYFYRLKMVEGDGSYNYSRTITLSGKAVFSASVYPTVSHQDYTLALRTLTPGNLKLHITNMLGMNVAQSSYALDAGLNELRLQLPASLPSGQYAVVLENFGKTLTVIKQ